MQRRRERRVSKSEEEKQSYSYVFFCGPLGSLRLCGEGTFQKPKI